VTEEDAAKKMEGGKMTLTGQRVKRAAPGGEGYVIDHFNKKAVEHYLARFDSAFANQQAGPPANFFNDSYEVYGANWTTDLPAEFRRRRGYDLMPYMGFFSKPEEDLTEEERLARSDYRETLSDLLYENFTLTWTEWAHRHGALTRNQAHGSPANLLDLYAAVDIPECEGFGLSNFGITGLRSDSGFTRKNFSDISMLKYASSGAHLSGHNLVSAESFTWLTEHFRTSLSQCKPELDLFFVSGVNHVYFHGSCYSPKGEEWPGWRFYASVDMSPYNNWWGAMPAFCKYIERCQSMLQWGEPDNDVLVYLPFYDMIYSSSGTMNLFDIHSMEKRAPEFIEAVQSIIAAGYDVDYVSDRYLLQEEVTNRYKAIIVPGVRFMPLPTLLRLSALARTGYKVFFVGNYPESVPGYGRRGEQDDMEKTLVAIKPWAPLVEDFQMALRKTSARPEPMRYEQGLSCLRRSNGTGYHYFISNLQARDVSEYVTLGVKAKVALLYDPMTGKVTRAKMNRKGKVLIQLKSGESVLLRTYDRTPQDIRLSSISKHRYLPSTEPRTEVLRGWRLAFEKAQPIPINTVYEMNAPRSWTELDSPLCNTTMATGVYSTNFTLPAVRKGEICMLDLGDVRETARVMVNGKECGTLFAVPYLMDITDYVHEGENTLQVAVANLPANRIAQMDREGVRWRRFKEINMVDLNYKKSTYSEWKPMPSGLCSEVKLRVYR